MAVFEQKTLYRTFKVPNFEESMPLMITFAPNWPIRSLLFRIFGTALIVGAAAMWLLPGAQTTPDLILMKLGSSLFFFLCGLTLLMFHHSDNQPDAYFDPVRCELRVLQKNNRGRPQTVLRRSYDSLGSARFRDRCVEMYDVDGSLLMRLPIEDAEVRFALRNQLSGLVNITS